jgi:hypothetical protein
MMVAITVAIASRDYGLDYRAGWLTVALTAVAVVIGVGTATRRRTRRCR